MFQAILLTLEGKATQAALVSLDEAALPEGDVDVDVAASTLNYKDALAITGRGAIVRRWPMVPGIDLAGTVRASRHPDWAPGDRVVVTGWGLGETHWGGLAARARLQGAWLLRVPEALSLRQCMAVGTAGVTAALCVDALVRHGIAPESGEILVTGAAGGVGSMAVAILGGLGYRVVASTGRTEEAPYLHALGAVEVIDRATLSAPGRPMVSERWAGVVDTVGSHTLANAIAATRWYGAVAACGLAQGADLPGSVLPFILRGVTLYGINSVAVPNAQRARCWDLLLRAVGPDRIDQMSAEIPLSDAIAAAPRVLAGQVRGRLVVALP